MNTTPWIGPRLLRRRFLAHLYSLPEFPQKEMQREDNQEFKAAWAEVAGTLGNFKRLGQVAFEAHLLARLKHPERIAQHLFPAPKPAPVPPPQYGSPLGRLSPSKAKRVTDRQARKVLKLRSKTHPEDYKAGNRLFRGRRRLLRAAYLHHFTSDPRAHAKAREVFDHAWKTTSVAKVPGQAFFQGLFEHALIQSLPNGETLRRHLLPSR